MYYQTNYLSPIGNMTLASSDKGLIGVWLEGQKYECNTLPKKDIIRSNSFSILLESQKWLTDYFNHLRPDISRLPLDFIGSAFQKCVWNILVKIPYGEVVTYRDIAKEIAAERGIPKMSAQAVGGAVGRNPISVIVPCHRVVGSSGSLTGYAGGMDKKIKLLSHEGVNINQFFIPKPKKKDHVSARENA